MSNNLIERVGRIISSHLNSLIEALENSDANTIIAKATVEIDAALEEIRTKLGRCTAARHLAATHLQEEKLKHSELGHKIKKALMEDNEENASAAIEKQIDIESRSTALKATISQYTQREKLLESYLKALASKKRQLNDELQYYVKSSQKKSDHNHRYDFVDKETCLTTRIEKANLAFDRVMERKDALRPQTEEELNTSSQLSELEAMALKTKVQERLAAVKRRMNKND